MTRGRVTGSWAIAAAMATALLSGCAPAAPAPSPTPTGFASEEEAFAAAEETYRAYVAALNAVDLSDPATFEPVYALTTGDARDQEKRGLTQMHADGWSVEGVTRIDAIYAGDTRNEVIVCLDVSEVEVLDSEGESQVSDVRPDLYALRIGISATNKTTVRALITDSEAIEDDRCVP
ncbi:MULTISPECIES: hypothetical protein [unclassified Microbacterium]|uniref:hypothetical protein n=1 Tax=unclassified Microbacterium TaxID=2609290 RepID=UPI00386E0BCB